MKEALKRLQRLQRRLEELHRETASVLAESHRLMGDVERESSAQVPPLPPPVDAPAAKRTRRTRR